MSFTAIEPCADYEESAVRYALDRVLSAVGGLDWVKPGMKIAVKANLVTMMKPESAATTHPMLLCALCERLISRGASVVVGDSPGGLYASAYVNAVYAATGVRAVLKTGASLNQDFGHRHADNPGGTVLKELEYTSWLDDADAIINFCKLKTHGMMGMSACVKNMFGAIPGAFKPEYHYKYPSHEQFANMLVDLNERFRPRLCVVDAVVGMEGNGPTMGRPRRIGALIAGTSPYACDRVCARVIGLDPDGLETVRAARARGLEDEATVVGDVSSFVVSDYDLVRARKDISFDRELPGLAGKALGRLLQGALCAVPKVRAAECIGCEKCRSICPAKAIRMENRLPRIDRGACIRCFCCQEFCPKGAMKVRRPLIARLINR